MVLRYSKRKLIILSFGLIITGLLISIAGFATSGFNSKIFITNGKYKWYRTINIYDDSFEWEINFK